MFTAEEWVNDTRNTAKTGASLRVDTDKALGATEQKIQDLNTKLIEEKGGDEALRPGLKMLKARLRNNTRSSTTLK